MSGVDSTSDVCRDERRVEVAGVDEEVVAAAGAGVAGVVSAGFRGDVGGVFLF